MNFHHYNGKGNSAILSETLIHPPARRNYTIMRNVEGRERGFTITAIIILRCCTIPWSRERCDFPSLLNTNTSRPAVLSENSVSPPAYRHYINKRQLTHMSAATFICFVKIIKQTQTTARARPPFRTIRHADAPPPFGATHVRSNVRPPPRLGNFCDQLRYLRF